MNALVLGIFDDGNKQNPVNVYEPKSLFSKYDMKCNGELKDRMKPYGTLELKKTVVVQKIFPEYPIIAIVGLGPVNAGYNPMEELCEKENNIRKAIAEAVSVIRSLGINDLQEIHFDACGDAEQVAISAIVSDWVFDEFKDKSLKRKPVNYVLADNSNSKDVEAFERGSTIAHLQNFCRRLQEIPANIMTPTRFADDAKQICEPLGVKVIVHDKEWAKEKKMFSFLSVANGSNVPCKFLELYYMTADERRPLVFVGKGVTFDSGGISLKPSSDMCLMRGDMSGAAVVLSSIAALAKLKSKVNVIGLIPLTENMPDGQATKPGDVVYAMNGKSIQIDNTDAEGRLILADALCYADTFDPEVVVDIATLTGACKIALGDVAAAVMTTSNKYWEMIRESGHETGDRVWRLPLFNDYARLVKDAPLADLLNISKEPSVGAGTILAAKFLQEFTKCKNWMHVDMANVKHVNSKVALGKGMTGAPLRTMIRFIQKVFL